MTVQLHVTILSDTIRNVHRTKISRTFAIYLMVALIVRTTTDYEKPEPSQRLPFTASSLKNKEVSDNLIDISAGLLFPSNLGLEMACNFKQLSHLN